MKEPFSLFNFLQSLLPNQPDDSSNEPSSNIEEPSPQKTPPVSCETDYQNNACLAFIARHDERAKRTKR